MPKTTKPLRERIVLIFDFDDTLGPSTTESYFEHVGLDYEDFDARTDQRIQEMWQAPLACADLLREYSHREDSPINRKSMEAFGREYPLFPDAEKMVDRLKKHLEKQDKDVQLEFVLLTAGFKTIPESSVIGEQFDRVYGGELEFDRQGRVLAARRVISHVDKVHYIQQLAQGRDLDDASKLENTYLHTDADDYYVPMDQIIYVGDGHSDMSAFQVVEEGGGVGLAIDPDGDGQLESADQMAPGRRVHNYAAADYREDSELMRSLKLAIDLMLARIQLLRLGGDD
jgi:phosphoserine phosphatase